MGALLDEVDCFEDISISSQCAGSSSLDDLVGLLNKNIAAALETNHEMITLQKELAGQITFDKISNLLKETPVPATVAGQVDFMLNQSWSQYQVGRYYGSYKYLNRAYVLIQEAELENQQQKNQLMYKMLRLCGHWHFPMNLMESSLGYYKEALARLEQTEDASLVSQEDMALINIDIGDALSELGRYDQALRFYNKGVRIYEESILDEGHNGDFADLLWKRSKLYKKLGQMDLANKDLERQERYKHTHDKLVELFIKTARQIGAGPGLIDMDKFPAATRKQLKGLYAQLGEEHMNMFALDGDRVVYTGKGSFLSEQEKDEVETFLEEGRFIKSRLPW